MEQGMWAGGTEWGVARAFCLSIGVVAWDIGRWRSGFFAFCFRAWRGVFCKSLARRGLQIVAWCAKSIAIDKMESFCPGCGARRPRNAVPAARSDRQNGRPICFILCAGLVLGPVNRGDVRSVRRANAAVRLSGRRGRRAKDCESIRLLLFLCILYNLFTEVKRCFRPGFAFER